MGTLGLLITWLRQGGTASQRRDRGGWTRIGYSGRLAGAQDTADQRCADRQGGGSSRPRGDIRASVWRVDATDLRAD